MREIRTSGATRGAGTTRMVRNHCGTGGKPAGNCGQSSNLHGSSTRPYSTEICGFPLPDKTSWCRPARSFEKRG